MTSKTVGGESLTHGSEWGDTDSIYYGELGPYSTVALAPACPDLSEILSGQGVPTTLMQVASCKAIGFLLGVQFLSFVSEE